MKSKLTSVAIKLGLTGALMNIIALIVLFYIGKHPLLQSPLLDARWPLYGIFIYFSIKEFRHQQKEVLHFWQGLIIGISVYLIMALGGALFIYVFSEVTSTHFLAEFIKIKTEQLIANKEMYIESVAIGENTYNQALAGLPDTKSIQLAFVYFKQSILIAMLPTILLPILMRRS